MIAAVRRLWRLPQVIALLFGGLFTVIVLFPLWREPARRTAIRVWSRMLLAGCGLRLSERTAPGARPLHALPPGRLVVANHLSWLDIFAIDALCPASFVAKSEIAGWPLVGTLVARAGTLFIERGRRHAVHRLIEHIDRSLQAGGRVAVFPEGTTGAGHGLLPFHANLIQAAVDAQAPVVPVGVRYLDAQGRPAQATDFSGDITFVASMWRVLGAGGVVCEVHVLPEIAHQDPAAPAERSKQRHRIAESARASISSRLGLPFDDTMPETLDRARRGGRTSHREQPERPNPPE